MFKFSDFLIFCSGANRHYLDQCPNERHKFYPIGLSILVTTSLAIISMYYAANLIFGKSGNDNMNQWAILAFSLFWGVAIFSIDWGLVKTMRKSKDGKNFFVELLRPAVIFRILVAVVISVSISRPIELAIYEKRLKLQIVEDRDKRLDRKQKEIQTTDNKLFGNPINAANERQDSIIDLKEKGPNTLTFRKNTDNYENCQVELENTRKINQNKINNLNAQNRSILNNPLYKDDINNLPTKDAKNLVNRNNSIIRVLQNEIKNKSRECQLILDMINKEKASFDSSLSVIEKNINAQLDDLNEEREKRRKSDSLAKSLLQNEAMISLDPENPGLITSLEALANFEKSEEGRRVKDIRWVLLLIFIFIDTAPIVVKLLTKRGPYEELQEAEEEKMRYLATAEKNANMLLISNIATAQNRILRQAVNRYENEELERLRQEPSYFREIVQTDSSESGAQSNQNSSSQSNNPSNSTEE